VSVYIIIYVLCFVREKGFRKFYESKITFIIFYKKSRQGEESRRMNGEKIIDGNIFPFIAAHISKRKVHL